MSTTRAALQASLEKRLESLGVQWTPVEFASLLDDAIEGLYPTFFKYNVSTTTATTGPVQTMPVTARNLYMVGLQRVGSGRVRPLRNWFEGQGTTSISKTNVEGATLVWAWTSGWTKPADEDDPLDLIPESVEVLLLRCEIACLESALSERIQGDVYHAIQVRQGVTEDDLVNALQAKHAALQERLDHVMPLPEVLK